MIDSKIVDLYWARSEQAIEQTDKTYGHYFYSVAYSILRNHEDSREIVNDTYLKAWNSIPPARPNNLKAFVGRITRQLSINRLEKNLAKKRDGGQSEMALDELAECIPDKDNDVNAAELRNAINAFLRSLPDEPRRVFIRRYWHMSRISEIANDFSMSESKVKSMLMRTREKLKKYLLRKEFSI